MVAAGDSTIAYGRSMLDQWQRADDVMGQTADDMTGKLSLVKMSLEETTQLSDAGRGVELVRSDSRRAVQNCVHDLELSLQVAQSKLWEQSCQEASVKVQGFSRSVEGFTAFWFSIRRRNGL
jgi:hypothetical protein